MKRIFVVGSVLLLVLFALVEFTRPRTSGRIVEWKPQEDRSSSEKLRRELDRVQTKYQADCKQLLADFNRRLETEIPPDFVSAENAVPKVVGDLSSLGAGVKLCYKLAKDKLSGSRDFEEAYQAALDEPVIQPCLHARLVANGLLEELRERLRERFTQYSMDIAQLCSTEGIEFELPQTDLEQLDAALSTFVAKGKELQMNQGAAALGTVFELIFIQQSYAVLRNLFAESAAKVASSLGIGGVCAVADGPIPVGDIVGGIVTVGGLAWTAYDIYQVTHVLPEKMSEELRQGIRQTRDTLMEESRNLAQNLAAGYCRSGSASHEQLMEQMK